MTKTMSDNLTKLGIRAERQTMMAKREREIEAIRDKYRPLLDALDETLKNVRAAEERAKRQYPTPAMLRYLQADDAPMRPCAGCGEPILTATIANAKAVEATVGDGVRDVEEMPCSAPILRRMYNATHCCHCCRTMGEGHHSRQCFSAIQQAERRQESGE